jgi:hypothetical protein
MYFYKQENKPLQLQSVILFENAGAVTQNKADY